MTSIIARYLDCTITDFFAGAGDAGEILAVPVTGPRMTPADLYKAAKEAYHASAPGPGMDYDGSGTDGEEALRSLCKQMGEPTQPMDCVRFVEELTENEMDAEPVYIYIGLYLEADS